MTKPFTNHFSQEVWKIDIEPSLVPESVTVCLFDSQHLTAIEAFDRNGGWVRASISTMGEDAYVVSENDLSIPL